MADRSGVVPLPTTAALELAHALVARLLEEESLDALVVKGIANVHHGLRSAGGTDVDLLIRPTHGPRLVAALAARGWVVRPIAEGQSRLMPYHAISMIHPTWPCDIDIHAYFPGCFADPEVTFEALHARRESTVVADVVVPITDKVSSLLILLLNGLRSGRSGPRSGTASAHLALADSGTRASLLDLAATTRSVSLIAPLVGDAPVMPANDLTEDELTRWRLWSEEPDIGVRAALYELRWATWPERARLLSRMLWKSPRDLLVDRPDLPRPLVGLRGNVGRWRRGLPSLSDGLRSVLRTARPSAAADQGRPASREWAVGAEASPQAPVQFARQVQEALSRGSAARPSPRAGSPVRPDDRVVLRPCVWTYHDAAAYVVSLAPGPGSVHVLRGSGSVIFEALHSGGSVAEIARGIAEGGGWDVEMVTGGVLTMVGELSALGMLEVRAGRRQA